jgi:hypothetical protein
MFRISGVGAALLPSLPAGAKEVPAGTQIPGIYRLKVGTYEVTILSGTAALHKCHEEASSCAPSR